MTFLSWKNMFTDCLIPFVSSWACERDSSVVKGRGAVLCDRPLLISEARHWWIPSTLKGTAIPITFWRRKEGNYLLESPVILLYIKFMRQQCNLLCFVIYYHCIFQDTGACGLLEKYQQVILQQQLFSSVTPSKHMSSTLWLLPEVRGARRNKLYHQPRVKAQGEEVTDIPKLKCRALFKGCRSWKKALKDRNHLFSEAWEALGGLMGVITRYL